MTLPSLKSVTKALSIAGLLAFSSVSQAAPIFAARISDGINTLTITDGSVADTSSDSGIIAFVGNNVFGNWNVSFVVGTSTFNPLEMHMSSGFSAFTSNFTSGESKKLTISLSQTGLSSGLGTNNVMFVANGGGSGSGTSGWTAYADDSNALFGTGSTVVNSTGFSTTAGSAAISMTDEYSATLISTFDISGVTSLLAAASQDLTLKVPEPGTTALLGLGLLGFCFARRRKVA